MVTIMVLGLDQYITGHFSSEATPIISKILDIKEEEILFYAPESNLFFKGVEQTSWQGLILVNLPSTLAKKEADLAEYLLEATSDFLLNLAVEFHYFETKNTYERINEEYSRFITEDQLRTVDDDNEDQEVDDAEISDDDYLTSAIYGGDVFAEFETKARATGHDLEEDNHHHHHHPHMECCEGDECDCEDGECDCEKESK
ncbi:MAG: hypothetical protein WCS68_01915 [Bacilli bacterium]